MEFIWSVTEEKTLLRTFLKEQGMSKKLLAKVKFHGGQLLVNGEEQTVRQFVVAGDEVTVIIPDEGEHETLIPYKSDIDIVFEDDHLLVVNKPSGVASIPSQYHKEDTMAHRVKYYYNQQGYANRVIHVVTRLDRDTTGLMLFAKHGFSHAMMDRQLRSKELKKFYVALVSGDIYSLPKEDVIRLPIGRDMTSLVKRQVIETGQMGITEYTIKNSHDDIASVGIQLHTGRTHQIRVHFSAIGYPLLGDSMYGGEMDRGIERQALHCERLELRHPFTNEPLELRQEIPNDMKRLVVPID